MALNKVTFETDTHSITIQRMISTNNWHLQTIEGLNKHIESVEFNSFKRAYTYAAHNYFNDDRK